MNQNLGEKIEENYIISESQEISVGEASGWSKKFLSAFPAFKHKNYQLYFTGQLISLIGTWLQTVAQGWLVLELTHSVFLIGLVSALGSLPTLFFTPFGGVIVDRLPKKQIIIFTQASLMILAFVLGLLTIFKVVNVVEIAILAFLLGLVTAIDMPARQAFVVEMVGRKDLASAIALNSGIFNGARVIGPAIAGITIALLGTGGAFLLNGISYIAVIVALILVRVAEIIPKVHPHPLDSIKEGFKYSFSNQTIKILLIFTGVTSIFGWSYSTVMPVVVHDIFKGGADSLGYFYSSAGAGAVLGVILVSAFSKKVDNLFFIFGGNFLFVLSIILFSFTTNALVAFIFLFLSGFGLISQFATVNTSIQHVVPDNIRGRVMSMYTLMFLGMTPIGSFQVGFFAERFGPQFAIRLGALIMLVFGIYLFLNKEKIQLKN